MTRNFVHIAVGSQIKDLAENNGLERWFNRACSFNLSHLGTKKWDEAWFCFSLSAVSKNQHIIPWWVLTTLTNDGFNAPIIRCPSNSVPTRVSKGPFFLTYLFCSTFFAFGNGQNRQHHILWELRSITTVFSENNGTHSVAMFLFSQVHFLSLKESSDNDSQNMGRAETVKNWKSVGEFG